MQGQIAKGAIISYIAIFLNIAITFFYTPWMIRQIGVSDYGLYSLTSTFIAYFIIDFGLAGAIARFIAKYRAEGRQDKVENMLGLTTKIYLFIDCLIFAVLFVCYFFLTDIFKGLTNEELDKLKVLYVIAGSFSILSFVLHPMNGAMMAYEYFVENKLLDMFQRVGTVVLIVIALLLKGSVFELVFITGSIGFLSSVAKFVIFKYKSKIHINWKFYDKIETRILLTFSFWVFINSLAQGLRLTMMPTVLGALANSTQISVFSIGMTIEAMVYTLSSALNGLFLPKVTRMIHGDNGPKEVTDLMIKVGRLQLYILSLILLGFLLIGDVFIKLWIGEDFHYSYYVVILLTLVNLVSMTQSIAGDMVYAENRIKYVALFTLGSSSLSLIIAVLLASRFGAVGCAVAYFIAMSFNMFIVNIFLNNSLKIEIGRFFRNCHYKILPSLLLITVLFFLIKILIDINNWLSLVLFTSTFVIFYLLVCYFFLFNEEEKRIVQIVKLK